MKTGMPMRSTTYKIRVALIQLMRKFGMFTSTLLALACCVGGTFSTGGYPASSNGHFQPLAISFTFVDKGLVEAELKDGDEDKDHAHLGNPVIANRHHQILVSTSNQTSAMVA